MARGAPHSPEIVNGKAVSAVDWLGNRFAVGDKVMYCISAGRGQMMAVGEVLDIKLIPKLQYVRDRDAEEYDDNMKVRWAEDDIAVQVKTLKTSGRWNNTERTRPAWVNPMNITALKPLGEA